MSITPDFANKVGGANNSKSRPGPVDMQEKPCVTKQGLSAGNNGSVLPGTVPAWPPHMAVGRTLDKNS